jgi:hypothetical protein
VSRFRSGAPPPPPEDEDPDDERPNEPVDQDDAPPSGFDAWRRRSAAGEVGTAVARGLGAVFAPTENKPVVSAPVPGDPPDPAQGFRVVLDPDDPAKSVAVFRPEQGATEPEDEPGV